MKLILGTASLGPIAYGEGIVNPPSSEEVNKILDCAASGGIETLEGAEAYQCDPLLQDTRFNLIYKVTHPYDLNSKLVDLERDYLMGLMYHHSYTSRPQMPLLDARIQYIGASVYDYLQLIGSEGILEVPLNIEDGRFKAITAPCKLARSVFGRGTLLKQYSIKECLDFVKAIPSVHGIVVGVNSTTELEQILKVW